MRRRDLLSRPPIRSRRRSSPSSPGPPTEGPRRSNARGREDAQRDLREALTSVLYAAHLGDPEGPALAADNVALRHDFGFNSARPGVTPTTAWRIPVETFGHADGWRIQGSLLSLDPGLRRLALRRLDSGQLPDDHEQLFVMLRAIYEARNPGVSIETPEKDRERFGRYAKAYAAAGGPQHALVERWKKFLEGK